MLSCTEYNNLDNSINITYRQEIKDLLWCWRSSMALIQLTHCQCDILKVRSTFAHRIMTWINIPCSHLIARLCCNIPTILSLSLNFNKKSLMIKPYSCFVCAGDCTWSCKHSRQVLFLWAAFLVHGSYFQWQRQKKEFSHLNTMIFSIWLFK